MEYENVFKAHQLLQRRLVGENSIQSPVHICFHVQYANMKGESLMILVVKIDARLREEKSGNVTL